MLESYVSPYLLGYINKYIKNLKPEDLQLSLWGGDLVLNHLDLRLETLERELNLPLAFVSGHIHELRIHVPWSRLGSEPVVVTINTIDLSLKLRDSESADHDSDSSSSTSSKTSKAVSEIKSPKRQTHNDEEMPPGYVQSLMNRIINNVSIVVNNLILKYTEGDMVLSINIQSLESFSANQNWEQQFIDLALPDLVLRRIIEVSDLTVCLDKRNASGKIENYQEPVVYRCQLDIRILSTYGHLNSKRASAIKLSLHCNELNMSLSDQQLPMFIRVVQLVLALYYGEIDLPGKEDNDDGSTKNDEKVNPSDAITDGNAVSSEFGPEEHPPGWMAWAWSYVPELISYEDDEDPDNEGTTNRKPPTTTLSIGMYCSTASITFKMTEFIANRSFYGPPKPTFKPYLRLHLNGATLEVLLHGLTFFNVQIAFSEIQLNGIGNCTCGTDEAFEDYLDSHSIKPQAHFMSIGDKDYEAKLPNYKYNSLFDPMSAENNSSRTLYILDTEHHNQKYTENWAQTRWGAFWIDYLYTMEEPSEPQLEASENSSQHSHQSTTVDPIFEFKEVSNQRIVFFAGDVHVNSSMVHRVQKAITYANDHDYEPYSKAKPEIVDVSRPVPTSDQIEQLEDFVPSRSTHFTVLGLNLTVSAAEHSQYDEKQSTLYPEKLDLKDDDFASKTVLLPALAVQVDRLDVQSTLPMYSRKLIKAISKVQRPSDNLLHGCYSHNYYKLFGVQVGLTQVDYTETSNPIILNLLPSFSVAAYHRKLLLPMYWTNPRNITSEMLVECPSIAANATKAQLLLLQELYKTWTDEVPMLERFEEVSLQQDIFKPSVQAFPSGQPMLEFSSSDIEIKTSETSLVKAMSGTLGSAKLLIQSLENGKVISTPLFQAPVDTAKVHTVEYYEKEEKPNIQPGVYQQDVVTFTCQIPKATEKATAHDETGLILIDIQGLAFCLDPLFYQWLTYTPRPVGVWKSGGRGTTMTPSKSTPFQTKASIKGSANNSKAKDETTKLSGTKQLPNQDQHPSMDGNKQATKVDDANAMVQEYLAKLKNFSIQIDLECCSIYLPATHIQIPKSAPPTIPLLFRHLALSENDMPPTAVLCLPTVTINSIGHRKIAALQDIPIDQSLLVKETGQKFPWSIAASSLSLYTLHPMSTTLYLLEPMTVNSTLAVTSSAGGPSAKNVLGFCLHSDMKTVKVNCSKPQVSLLASVSCAAIEAIQQTTLKASKQRRHKSRSQSMDSKQMPQRSPVKTLSSVSSSGQPEKAQGQEASTNLSSTIEVSSTPDSEENEGSTSGLRLSLWLQLTLNKFSLNLFSEDCNGKAQELKLQSDLEDLTFSLDIQEVYSKMKCKIGGLNVKHYIKWNKSWIPGPYKGVILSCTDMITKQLPLVSRIASQKSSASYGLHAQRSPAKSRDSKTHGFLTLTFTRALSKSVKKRLYRSKLKVQEPIAKMNQYVNEVVLSTQPCDIVVWCPVLASMLNIFMIDLSTSSLRQGESGQIQPSLKRHERVRRSLRSPPSVASSMTASEITRTSASKKSVNEEIISTRKLPLLYIDCQEFRLFLPGSDPNKPHALSGEISQDCFLAHVKSISLTPNVDNPLQRMILKQEIYRKAMHAGITQQPGSEVEDRQYQLDINAVSLCTVLWEDVAMASDQGVQEIGSADDSSVTLTQNPALEWNMAKARQSPQQISISPIIHSFDLRVVAAPAIIMDKPSADPTSKKRITVCGHSLEFNITSDVDLYLSAGQVLLAQMALQTNIGAFSTVSSSYTTKGKTTSSKVSEEIPLVRVRPVEDSGLGSETSSVNLIPSSIEGQSGERMTNLLSGKLEKPKKRKTKFTPFDILLTAGKISFMVYSRRFTSEPLRHNNQKTNNDRGKKSSSITKQMSALCLEQDITRKNQQNVWNNEDGCTSSVAIEMDAYDADEESTDDKDEEEKTVKVIHPFLYLVLSQPHVIISMEKVSQRAEFSVYDFSIDGTSINFRETDATKQVPDSGDYTVSWLETCPGDPDPKTGILPSLFTFTVKDFFSRPAIMNMSVCRPMRAHLSLTKMDQFFDFLRKLSPLTSFKFNADLTKMEVRQEQIRSISTNLSSLKELEADEAVEGDTSQYSNALSYLAMIQQVTLNMHQIVIVMTTKPHPKLPILLFSLGSCQGSVVVKSEDGMPSQLVSTLALKELLLKTSLQHVTKTFIGPSKADMGIDARWCYHSGNTFSDLIPRCHFDLHVGHIQVSFGQEHLSCLQLITEQVQEIGDSNITKESDNKPSNKRRRKDTHSEEVICRSTDDLRAGAFRYHSDIDGIGLLPKPNEIMFCTEPDGNAWNQGAMTWCYPEPRVLTKVLVTPLPLNAAVTSRETEQNSEVPCLIQYWDNTRKCFTSFRLLCLSESSSCEVKLPYVEQEPSHHLVAAELWRVIVNYTSENQPEGTVQSVYPLLSPMALAASMRVDSCFCPRFVPAFTSAVHVDMVELKLANHFNQLGKGLSKRFEPFKLDKLNPKDQEFMTVTLEESMVMASTWGSRQEKVILEASSTVSCNLLEYRNLTVQRFLEPCEFEVSLDLDSGVVCEMQADLGPMNVNLGQSTIHTLNSAVQAWNQYKEKEREELVLTYYTICNDTVETLRFGQVHTDESIVLPCRQMHAYSWRTHKTVHWGQKIHVCIEGWRNWRWSEPFSIDEQATIVRKLQHKGHSATLFICIRNVTPLQKQVVFYGQQLFSSRVNIPLEIQLNKIVQVGGSSMECKQTLSLPPEGVLPSLACDDESITSMRIKVGNRDSEWSEQMAVSGEMSRKNAIVKVSCKDEAILQLWCRIYTEEHSGETQRLIIFSPLFTVRSHLPRPLVMSLHTKKFSSVQVYNVKGQGNKLDLYDVIPSTWHSATFQLSENTSPSNPGIPVSTELLDEIVQMKDEAEEDEPKLTIPVLAYDWKKEIEASWPYIGSSGKRLSSIDTDVDTENSLIEDDIQQPNTDLKVSLHQHWSEVNTIIIDVMPWCLIVNQSHLDLVIIEEGEPNLYVKHRKAVAPQKFKGHINLVFEDSKQESISRDPIFILANKPPAWQDLGTNELPPEGSMLYSMTNKEDAENIWHLNITSSMKYGMRIISIRERVLMVNNSKYNLMVRLVDTSRCQEMISIKDQDSFHAIPIPYAKDKVHPVSEWNLPDGNKHVTFNTPRQLYVSVAVSDSVGLKQDSWEKWSKWVRLNDSRPRQAIAVPYSQANSLVETEPLLVLSHEHEGILYITIDVDPTPRTVIKNKCHFDLRFAQTFLESEFRDQGFILEDDESLQNISFIHSHSTRHFDIQQKPTSQTDSQHATPGLIFAHHTSHFRSLQESVLEHSIEEAEPADGNWTEAVALASSSDLKSEILTMPGIGYILVSSYCIASCLQIIVEPLSMSSKDDGTDEKTIEYQDYADMKEVEVEENEIGVATEMKIGLFFSELCIKILDQASQPVQVSELLCLLLEDACLLYYPSSNANSEVIQQNLHIAIGHVQLDNQSFSNGNFNFPVILVSDDEMLTKPVQKPVLQKISIEEQAEISHSEDTFVFHVILEKERLENGSGGVQSVNVKVLPLAAYLEDQLIFQLMTRYKSFIPSKLEESIEIIHDIPLVVRAVNQSLRLPICMQHLTIQPITVQASVHASLKMFISLDGTLLSFGKFDCRPVFTTSRQLVQALTMHYTSGALFKAGWAIGSLEILGNPAGLVRNIRSGIADSIYLPYEGLTRGPAAFVSGVTGGVSSLIKHVSAGTLSSVTNFASSVSRNLDRLTLDPDHIAMQEQQRRMVPDRVSSGLINGLSSFGISLLGAIAGIADQPIRGFQQAYNETLTQQATGVISGVGRGVMGVVIKPLGGAAQFVSQTGKGILHSTGLSPTLKPKHPVRNQLAAMAVNGQVKYMWKMLHTLRNPTILMCLDAVSVTYHGLHHSGVLLLTPEILFIVSSSEDTQQQAFPVSEIECRSKLNEEDMLYLDMKQAMTPTNQEKDTTASRVADFVDATSRFTLESDSQSEGSTAAEPHPNYCYEVDPRLRDTFISIFNQAKNRLLGKGFHGDDAQSSTLSKFKAWHLSATKRLDL
ncbi:vacuolar protein sorting-associated protein 13B-like [Anneissia japonica]|uniref:vacuolar protein sorting-associated protein 13B-like n=1 Tax=Anneissia japonica TaxID=1529436 RepID=UPI0014256FD7|nr:vacuolar protein sorting-associated protein 13B-like [Anneissia japonica]